MAEIPGIDDTLRKKEYIRRYNPILVTQRTIPDGREDLPQFLKELHLKENDLFEVLCRGHGICGNNPLYISRYGDEFMDIEEKIYIDNNIPNFDTDNYGWLDEYINEVDQEY